MIRSWLSYLEHAVEQAQEAGELTPGRARARSRSSSTPLQSANSQFHLFRDRAVFDEARRAVRERLESLRTA